MGESTPRGPSAREGEASRVKVAEIDMNFPFVSYGPREERETCGDEADIGAALKKDRI